MKPIESNYTSHVAYTRALEEYCETLGNKVAKQAAVIKKLRHLMRKHIQYAHHGSGYIEEALDIPTDSTQILQEWLDSVLGEPVAYTNETELYYAHYTRSDGKTTHGEFWRNYEEESDIPLFKKPEILK